MRAVVFGLALWLGLAGMALGQTTAPQIWLQPANQTGEAGGNVTFAAAASGSPAPALQWQVSTDGNTWSNVSGTGFSGGTTNMLTLIGATTTQSGNEFRCVATNSVTSTASNAVTLTVLPAGFVNVATIAAGGNFTLFIKSDGSLWTMGLNSSGELGDGTTNNKKTPEQIVSGGVIAISARSGTSLFLKNDGSAWAMGDNANGQLGDGTTNNKKTPEQIFSTGVVSIVACHHHSLFLKSDGSLWAVGDNSSGQLGDGTTKNETTPEEVVSSGVVAIAGAEYFSLFVKSDGSLWAMGNNTSGQLGDGTTTNHSSPEQIVASGVIAVSANGYHSMFLKNDGSLWAMGDNSSGQLGDGTTTQQNTPEQIVTSGVVKIAAGYDHALFVKNDGSLWAVGSDGTGQLGDGTTTNRSTFEEILTSGIIAITAGVGHSLFLKSDGSLWAMGYNQYGQLGDGTNTEANIPELILQGFAYPAVSTQATLAAVIAGANPTFTVAAGGSPTPTYQWQVSPDGGQTWTNLSDNTTYAGTASATLTVNGATSTQLGYQFQAVVTNSVGTTISAPVALVVGSSSAKLAWLQNNFNATQLGEPSIIGDLAMPANDGIPNLIKYAFNLPALVNAQSLLPQLKTGNGNLTLTFQPLQADLTYTVEASTDLTNWSATGVNKTINAGTETASYPIPANNSAFLHIVIAPSL